MATRDTYITQQWKDLPDRETPVSAKRLAYIEQGIKDAMDKRALKDIYNDYSINLGRKEGSNTGHLSTAEGSGTIAADDYTHAEGYQTIAGGKKSHAEGGATTAGGICSHAEGESTTAGGYSSHAEGNNTRAIGDHSHAEGYDTTAQASYSHAEGHKTLATGGQSHAEGYETRAPGSSAHAEGDNTVASGSQSHAEGFRTTALGSQSHVEGYDNKEESGSFSANHIEGTGNILSGNNSYMHVSGRNNRTQGSNYNVNMSGDHNMSPGYGGGTYSGMITGSNNVLYDSYQFVAGKYCQPKQGAVVIGGGNSGTDRRNILFLDWEGNLVVTGDVINGEGVSLSSLKAAVDNIEQNILGGRS